MNSVDLTHFREIVDNLDCDTRAAFHLLADALCEAEAMILAQSKQIMILNHNISEIDRTKVNAG